MNLARILYESFPHADLMNLDPSTDLNELATLNEAAKDCGDPLFRFIVNEATEGAEGNPRVYASPRSSIFCRCLDFDKGDAKNSS